MMESILTTFKQNPEEVIPYVLQNVPVSGLTKDEVEYFVDLAERLLAEKLSIAASDLSKSVKAYLGRTKPSLVQRASLDFLPYTSLNNVSISTICRAIKVWDFLCVPLEAEERVIHTLAHRMVEYTILPWPPRLRYDNINPCYRSLFIRTDQFQQLRSIGPTRIYQGVAKKLMYLSLHDSYYKFKNKPIFQGYPLDASCDEEKDTSTDFIIYAVQQGDFDAVEYTHSLDYFAKGLTCSEALRRYSDVYSDEYVRARNLRGMYREDVMKFAVKSRLLHMVMMIDTMEYPWGPDEICQAVQLDALDIFIYLLQKRPEFIERPSLIAYAIKHKSEHCRRYLDRLAKSRQQR